MKALDRGEAYDWDDEIPNPRERPERVPPVELLPKPEAAATSWIGDAQALALLALSAAAQRPDADALALLETVPREAWGCSPELRDIVDLTTNAIRIGQPEGFMPEVLDSVGHDGDPWALRDYCDLLSKLWVAFHAATRTLPREKPEAEVKAEPEPEAKTKALALPGFTDFTDVWNIADLEVPHLFREGSFPLEELSLIASEPGTGKTTVSIGLGLSVALGRGLLAGFTPHRAGKVAMYLSEDGAIPTAKRLRAWCELTGVSRVELERAILDGRLSFCCGESAALLDYSTGVCRRTAAHRELLEACERENYDLLVVDSLIEWAGVPNENDNAQMQQGAKALIELARASGGSVLSLHHSNKASDKSNAVGLQAIRGGTALAGKVRWAALLSHVHPEDVARYAIPEEDRFRHLRLDVVKTQYAERPGLPIYLERRAGGALEAVKLVAPKSKDSLLSLARALAEAIGDNPARLTKWDVIQKKPGVEFRAKFKWSQPDATVRNIGLAYELAVAEGLISEEYGEETEHGQAPIIPRKTYQEGVDDAY